jgi:RNA polymerase sigma factor (sigma-70 family)
MTDESIEAAKARRFQVVVLSHLDAAYNLARWLMRNEHDAEDIVQEACLRAFRSFDSFRGDDARPWLLTIVRNACYSWFTVHRPDKLSTPFDEELHGGGIDGADVFGPGGGLDPETAFARADELRLVNEALDQLPLGFREVVVLRDLEELSYKEIAAVAAIPIGTVMSRLARGRRLLAAHLKERLKEN